jgi:hypothetical protein
MTAIEMHNLLKDAKYALFQNDIWHRGTAEGFTHILYCRYCHYSQSHGHGDHCIVVRLGSAVDGGSEHG